jgi:phosphoenolpyruvate mutase
MATVYIGLTVDVLHHGHINLIKKGAEHGDVVIGLMTDRAVAQHKRLPYLTWEQRRDIVSSIYGVKLVVPQDSWSYADNIRQYKPDFMVHGDDWRTGPDSVLRTDAISALDEHGGKLIEVPYTKGVSSGAILSDSLIIGTTPDIRRKSLRRLLEAKPMVRLLEAHSPLSALIGESVNETIEGVRREFDGFWSSSLTDSTERGKPDIEALDISARLRNINDIFEVTTKPLVMDGDTGGKEEHFELNVRSMERLGISAVIIEDKTGLKKNSLLGNDTAQTQEDVNVFCNKIRAGRAALVSEDFMIIARIESLILDRGIDDALLRSRAYVNAGAHGIMIHSRQKRPDEVYKFANSFRQEFPTTPLVAVPTSYNSVTERELQEYGFNMVIYANQMLRSAYPAMKKNAQTILRHGRSLEIDEDLISISEILDLIPGTK